MEKRDVLIIGGGGREHALALKLAESPRLGRLHAIPGNPGIAEIGECHALDPLDNEGVVAFAKERGIRLVVIGPEAPLVNGLADDLRAAGIAAVGPGREGARFEASKGFSRRFMERHGLPSVPYREFTEYGEAAAYIRERGAPIVVKADGLAAGKGVLVARSVEEALAFARECLEGARFEEAGRTIVVEECLEGEEASYMLLTDGRSYRPLASSQDHKRAEDGDEGANTGGMGAYSPAPVLAGHEEELARLTEAFLEGLAAEGIEYRGVLYVGLMKTRAGLRILEFNVRFGDPEAQVLLPRLENDLLELLLATEEGRLGETELSWRPEACLCVVLASGGYPGPYRKGKEITGLEAATGVQVIHAGTATEEGRLVTAGGRVLNVVALGATLEEAAGKAYGQIPRIGFEGMRYRTDIGRRGMAR